MIRVITVCEMGGNRQEWNKIVSFTPNILRRMDGEPVTEKLIRLSRREFVKALPNHRS